MSTTAEYMREWRKKNPEQAHAISQKANRKWRDTSTEAYRASNRRAHAKARTAAINHYGGRCACCGEDQPQFLTIDHTNGGGAKHRREIGSGIYWWLKRNNWPKDFRVLCWNCNCALGYHGRCHGSFT